jgi:hypothetical protein
MREPGFPLQYVSLRRRNARTGKRISTSIPCAKKTFCQRGALSANHVLRGSDFMKFPSLLCKSNNLE